MGLKMTLDTLTMTWDDFPGVWGPQVAQISLKIRAVESDFKKSNKSRMPNIRFSDFFNSPCPCLCPCSCGHFKMRHTYVGPLVPEL